MPSHFWSIERLQTKKRPPELTDPTCSPVWDGVRNSTARIHLRAMKPGDFAFFYHSNEQKAAVGVMRITREGRPDGDDGKWVSVAVEPVKALARPVELKTIKAEPRLASLEM